MKIQKFLFAVITVTVLNVQINGQNWFEEEKIVASDRDDADFYGSIVDISGNYAIVGAYFDKHDTLGTTPKSEAGSAYIYEKDNFDNWNEVQKIVAFDRASLFRFGNAISISGNYLVVGSYQQGYDAQGGNILSHTGGAYIYERASTGYWQFVQKIVASDRDILDQFGYSVAIDGDYIIIGAHHDEDGLAGASQKSDAGSAYMFERNLSGTWVEVQKIVASDRYLGDFFGTSVSISGDYAFVGALGEDEDENGNNTLIMPGSVYIFKRNTSGVWSETQKIVSSDRNDADSFGRSLDVSGDYAVIGASAEDEDENGANILLGSGSAYIFALDTTEVWSETQKIVASDRDENTKFGYSIGISGNRIISGAYAESKDEDGIDTISLAGAAYIFKRDINGTWNEEQKIVASDRDVSDLFGFNVSISGNHTIIGAYLEDHDESGNISIPSAGSAYIYHTNDTLNTNISENKISTISLYPNPVNSYLTIDLGIMYPQSKVKIVNTVGQVVINSKQINQQFIYLNMESLKPGFYLIQIYSDSKTETLRIVKQ